jgi:undecaprenyl-diphosphatase
VRDRGRDEPGEQRNRGDAEQNHIGCLPLSRFAKTSPNVSPKLCAGYTPLMTTAGARDVAWRLVVGFAVAVAVLVACGTLVVHVLAHSAFGHWEMSGPQWLAARRTPRLDQVTQVLSRSGDTQGAVGIGLLVALVFAIRRHWRFIAVLVTGLVLELCTFLAVNTIVARPRPHVAHLGSVPTTSSFPSGHVAAAFVIYATLARYVTEHVRARWAAFVAWTVAVVVPLAIAFARVYRGMHYPTDVAFGLLMGIGVVVIVATSFARGERADEVRHRQENDAAQQRVAERSAA